MKIICPASDKIRLFFRILILIGFISASLVTFNSPALAVIVPSVVVSPNIASSNASYTVVLNLERQLGTGGYITLTFPSRAEVQTGNVTYNVSVIAAGLISTQNITVDAVGDNETRKIVIRLNSAGTILREGTEVTVNIGSQIVKNPSLYGHYSLIVSTSKETTPVTSFTYAILSPDVVPPIVLSRVPPNSPIVIAPPDHATGIIINPMFKWTQENDAVYDFQLSTDPFFDTTIISVSLPGNSFQLPSDGNVSLTQLSANTVYFWRVRAVSPKILSEAKGTNSSVRVIVDSLKSAWATAAFTTGVSESPLVQFPNTAETIERSTQPIQNFPIFVWIISATGAAIVVVTARLLKRK